MTKEEVHHAIDRLNEGQLRPVAALLEELLPRETNSLWDGLKGIAGIRVPPHWPPRFGKVRRERVNGELDLEEPRSERVDELFDWNTGLASVSLGHVETAATLVRQRVA